MSTTQEHTEGGIFLYDGNGYLKVYIDTIEWICEALGITLSAFFSEPERG